MAFVRACYNSRDRYCSTFWPITVLTDGGCLAYGIITQHRLFLHSFSEHAVDLPVSHTKYRSMTDVVHRALFRFSQGEFFGVGSEKSACSSNEGSDVATKRRRLSVSNGQLCAGACEKIPRTFAHKVPLFNLTTISSLVCVGVLVCWFVCALRFGLLTPLARDRFRPL